MVTPSSLAMVITETNSLQDHYRVPTMSPLPLAAIADMHPFPFMRLPIELRLQIYNDYLLDQYSPSPEQIHEKVLSPCWTKPPIEILQQQGGQSGSPKPPPAPKDHLSAGMLARCLLRWPCEVLFPSEKHGKHTFGL